LADTLDGPIKELRVGDQLRQLFSLENPGVLLIYGGERKKNGEVSPQLIEDANEMREASLGGRETIPIDFEELRKLLKRRRIQWPK